MQSEQQGVRSVASEVYNVAAVSIEASMWNAETASRECSLQGAGVPGQQELHGCHRRCMFWGSTWVRGSCTPMGEG